jgi:hypothetical protein
MMALTETEIKKAKPKEKAYRMSDGGGMYLNNIQILSCSVIGTTEDVVKLDSFTAIFARDNLLLIVGPASTLAPLLHVSSRLPG